MRAAYARLTHEQLILFAQLRRLPSSGCDDEISLRLATFDARLYNLLSITDFTTKPELSFNPFLNHAIANGAPSTSTSVDPTPMVSPSVEPQPFRSRRTPATAFDLPVEILADIMDHVADWALARAVGVPTSLVRPPDWVHASATDEALLTGYLPLVRAADPAAHPPTKIGADVAVRFGYVHVLEYFLAHHRALFPTVFQGDLIPVTAAAHGRTAVLSWWRRAAEAHPDVLPALSPRSAAEAVDDASRNGQVGALDWWFAHRAQLPFEYSEAALEYASHRGHIDVLTWWRTQHRDHGVLLKSGRAMDLASTAGRVDVLEWWARSGLEFKYDRQALHHASHHGKVEVLQWWAESGLQLIFDAEVLAGATRHNRPEVLEWWDKSGLPVQYRMCDIEEALEDAIGGGERAREWWRQKGVDFNANDKEWMKLQTLN